ncbi:MAG: hypothetical protein HQM10_20225 [Candidatus Riflebacteria bacterium]|nr:hypothetical protein [Candidatus Riflebacteria bacterium]
MKTRMLHVFGLFIFLPFLFFLGCSGGSGSGSTGGGTNVLNPVAPDPFSPLSSDKFAVPTGFSSTAFPASGNKFTISSLNSNESLVLSLVNNSGNAVSADLSLSQQAFAASITDEKTDYSESPSAGFHTSLRKLEKTMPSFVFNPSEDKSTKNPSVKMSKEGDVESFKIIVGSLSDGNYRTVRAVCRKVSPLPGGVSGNLNLFLDENVSYNSKVEKYITDLQSYWQVIYPTIRGVFGEEPPAGYNGLDSDITILLSSVIEEAGFFYSGDLYSSAQLQSGITNQRKMFYVNVDSKTGSVTAASTMAHEFQHMVNFYQRHSRNLTEADWLNEAMSGYAEHVCGFKMTENNGSKAEQVRLYLSKTYSINLMADPWPGSDPYPSYGQVYLFGTWLGSRFGENGSLKKLLAGSTTGKAAIESFTGQQFGVIFAKFVLALYVNDYSGYSDYGIPGINLVNSYQFNSATITLNGPYMFSNSGDLNKTHSVYVAPWSAAYYQISGSNGSDISVTVPGDISLFELRKLFN